MYLYVIVLLMKSLVPVTEGFARIPHGKSWMAKLKKKDLALFSSYLHTIIRELQKISKPHMYTFNVHKKPYGWRKYPFYIEEWWGNQHGMLNA